MDEIEDQDSLRWLRRGVMVAVVVLGWVFIAWQNLDLTGVDALQLI